MAFLEGYGEHIRIEPGKPIYRFLHFITPHGPSTTAENCVQIPASEVLEARVIQSKCTILATISLLRSLEAQGLYDKMAILIHGDHGIAMALGLPHPDEEPGIPKFIGNANPLILVKPIASRAPLRISESQVQLTDIPATIESLLSIPRTFPGQSMLDQGLDDRSDRVFFEFDPNRSVAFKTNRVTAVRGYEVSGPIFSRDSWKLATPETRVSPDAASSPKP